MLDVIILVGVRSQKHQDLPLDLPNLRLLMRAYAFLSADVLHFGSPKLFARNFSVAACSRFQLAMRHSPCSTAFFFKAR
jgi:hypothetical protein